MYTHTYMYVCTSVIVYLMLFRLEELGMGHFMKLIGTQHTGKMHKVLNFLPPPSSPPPSPPLPLPLPLPFPLPLPLPSPFISLPRPYHDLANFSLQFLRFFLENLKGWIKDEVCFMSGLSTQHAQISQRIPGGGDFQ